ncbi:MAG: hypothetical protein ACOC4M_10830 [Promethearchaeia archaeon]
MARFKLQSNSFLTGTCGNTSLIFLDSSSSDLTKGCHKIKKEAEEGNCLSDFSWNLLIGAFQ